MNQQEQEQGGELYEEAELAIRAAAHRALEPREIQTLRYAAGLINRATQTESNPNLNLNIGIEHA